MPPLRSIASPLPKAAAGEALHAAQEAAPGSFERLAAALSAPATLRAAQVC
jgi:hypothetical protein